MKPGAKPRNKPDPANLQRLQIKNQETAKAAMVDRDCRS